MRHKRQSTFLLQRARSRRSLFQSGSHLDQQNRSTMKGRGLRYLYLRGAFLNDGPLRALGGNRNVGFRAKAKIPSVADMGAHCCRGRGRISAQSAQEVALSSLLAGLVHSNSGRQTTHLAYDSAEFVVAPGARKSSRWEVRARMNPRIAPGLRAASDDSERPVCHGSSAPARSLDRMPRRLRPPLQAPSPR